MSTKILFLFLFVSLTSTVSLSAQEFEVPKNYSLVKAEDYEPYNQDVLNAIKWLENTPLDKQQDKRKNVSAFLMKWLTGSPKVSISINEYTIDLAEKNSELLMIFLGGWAEASINNSYKISDTEGNIAGIKSVVKFYNKNRKLGIKKNKTVEKLSKLKTDRDIEKWLKKNL